MRILVAFYSRTGVTRTAANEIAGQLKLTGHEVTVEEIIDKKDRSGIIGWLKSGRDSSRKTTTEINPLKNDIGAFDLIIIGTPVWAWNVTPAVRTFLSMHSNKIAKAAFFCTMNGSGNDKGTFKSMRELLGKEPAASLALRRKYVKTLEPVKFKAAVAEFCRM